MVPSLEESTSVPNSSFPKTLLRGFTIWIRCPAHTIVQSFGRASGTNLRSASSCESLLAKTSPTRYLTRSMF